MAINNTFYDKTFRNKIRNLDHESLATLLADSMDDVDIKVHTNTKGTFYFVIPDNSSLDTMDLSDIQAAKSGSASTVGTHTTLGSLFCVSGTWGSVSSFSSASSVATMR